ncbi:MAG TPA: TIGR02597 family protein [Verrucomicrobiae bacterium]|nr:TIGR02597 family protein [Verrucomicrobiae bacterium]
MQRVQHARGWSFLPKLTFVITIGLITAATGFKASAVDVFTDPVGFITITAEGTSGPGVSPALSLVGLGMTQIVASRGAITGIAGTTITVNNTLTAGQFAVGPNGPLYFIEFLDGANPGLQDDITGNTATTVTTASDDSGAITGATTYKIYPHWTLNSVFGAADQSGLNPITDQVLIQNPLTQTFTTYFFATASKSFPTAGWKQSGQGNTDFGQVPLYNDQGVLISRTVTTNLNILLVGGVKLGPTIIPLVGTNNLAANIYATSAVTLSNSGLFTDGNPSDSLVPITDLVLIHNDAAGTFNTYFYATASKSFPTAGWKQSGQGNTDFGGTPIGISSFMLIQLASGHPGFNWKAPAPY